MDSDDDFGIDASTEKYDVPDALPLRVPEPYVPPPKAAYEGYGGEDDDEDYEAAHPGRGGRESSRRVRQFTVAALEAGEDYGEAAGSDGDESFTMPKSKRGGGGGGGRPRASGRAAAQPPMRVGDEVKLRDDAERGVVTERLAGSWLMVKYASGYESKQRPGQLVALDGTPGLERLTDDERALCAAPLDLVISLQAHIDRDVAVATASHEGSVKNQYVDKDGAQRRQFIVFRDRGALGVRCDVCDVDQVLSDTIRAVAAADPSKVCHTLKAHCGYYAGSRASSDSERHICGLQKLVPPEVGTLGFGLVGSAKPVARFSAE